MKVTRKRPKVLGDVECEVIEVKVTEFRRILKIYPPGNDHISPFKGPFEDVLPFPNVGYYVSSLEGKW